jgi:hypothetical protein
MEGSYIEGLGGEGGLFSSPFSGLGYWTMCVIDFENNPIWINYSECFDFITLVPNIETNYSITIFPNPAKNTISIINPLNTKINNVTLYTQAGLKIFSVKAPFDTIDISNLKAGLYFVEITTDSGNVRKKLIVQ